MSIEDDRKRYLAEAVQFKQQFSSDSRFSIHTYLSEWGALPKYTSLLAASHGYNMIRDPNAREIMVGE